MRDGLLNGVDGMRVNAERKDRGKKLMQVLLIRTAEKTERKKIKERGLQTEKRTTPCREDFLVLYFSNYHSVVRKSVSVCVCTCE